MACEVKIIADSISPTGKRLTTFQLKYWRAIHSEVMTHRVFSRNASSSRAIPVAKMIEQVRTNPAMPIHWGLNQPGMQANDEVDDIAAAKVRWLSAAGLAADQADLMMEMGLHKQIVNRILEPFQYIHVVVTATEWDNFFELRAHKDAQPEIQELAIQMRNAMDASNPTVLHHGEWHLPYVTEADYDLVAYYHKDAMGMSDLEAWDDNRINEVLCKVSSARCCRVSYIKHDGTDSTIDEDIILCDRLAGAKPIHASPFEHVATPLLTSNVWSGNFQGWYQYRELVEKSFD